MRRREASRRENGDDGRNGQRDRASPYPPRHAAVPVGRRRPGAVEALATMRAVGHQQESQSEDSHP